MSSLLPRQKVEDFRRLVRGTSTENLRRNVDVYLPEGGRALVAEGQTAIAGETVLADLALTDAGRSYRVG